jgi:two-component system phosphate regulon response regulator PhoB
MADKEKILVVDDHVELVELVRLKLSQNGYQIITAYDGLTAEEKARTERPDMIVLDLGLPDRDGSDVAASLRREPATQHIPILMLTARASEGDIVDGFAVGADDYVTKPFSPQVLLARVQAILRRSSRGELKSHVISAGPVVMDLTRCLVTIDEEPVEMTRTEFRLLHALITAEGRAMTRPQLMKRALGEDVLVTDRTIDVHMTALRKKLGSARNLVSTVRAVGYKLADEYARKSGE